MKATRNLGTILALALVALAPIAPLTASADGEVELAKKMADLQYFGHKTGLSIDNKNKALANFYAHELEETIEDVAKIESYDGRPVGKLINAMLMPAFENFESALKSGDWKKTSVSFDQLLRTCNDCHNATEHGFITIERRRDNPFMQSFKSTDASGKPVK